MARNDDKQPEAPNPAVVPEPEPVRDPEQAAIDAIGDGDPYELVRYEDELGNQATTTRAAAAQAGVRVIDKPATDGRGDPLPPKYRLGSRAEDDAADTTEAGDTGNTTKES